MLKFSRVMASDRRFFFTKMEKADLDLPWINGPEKIQRECPVGMEQGQTGLVSQKCPLGSVWLNDKQYHSS